jgi:hypothetical protein
MQTALRMGQKFAGSIDADILLSLTRKKIDIDSLVEALAEQNAFDEYDEESAVRNWRKVQVRRAIKSLKGSDGLPLIFSIVDADENGKGVRKYKQEALFNVDEYRQVIEYCRQNRRRWSKMERQLIANAKAKFEEALF